MDDNIIKLNQFVVDNNELEILEAELKSFNPFKVLKLDTHEIRHSNILAWLLNPKDNHNLGDEFLKKVLGEVIIRNDNINIGKSAIDIFTGNFNDVEVLREKNNIDILIVSEKNKLILVIENKIYSNEHDDQLSRYMSSLKESYQGFDIVPVYLTLTGIKPISSNKWATLSYESIYRILNSILELYKDTLNSKIYDFISYYLNILEELTMQDDRVIELCKKIYKEHKDAIDLIVKYGPSPSFLNAVTLFIEENRDLVNLGSNNNMLTFIPKEFSDILPLIKSKENDYPIVFYFQRSGNKLELILEVEPFNNVRKRVKFLMHVRNKGNFKILDKSLTENSRYTRLFSKNSEIKNWDDRTEILNCMNELYHKTTDAKLKIIDAMNDFDWHYDKFTWEEGDVVIIEDDDK